MSEAQLVKIFPHSDYRINSKVAKELRSAIDTVKGLTGVDLGLKFGNASRKLDFRETKAGVDPLSWHKAGRAVDLNQGLKWLIVKEGTEQQMYFRLYLKKVMPQPSTFDKIFSESRDIPLLNSPFERSIYKNTYVDVTSVFQYFGFVRIPAHPGWENSWNKREWWHFEKTDGLSYYAALRELYSEKYITSSLRKLRSRLSENRLASVGFPHATIDRILRKGGYRFTLFS